MLPKPISVLNAPFDTFARRCKSTGTVHNRPPMPGVCAICIAPLWGVANADDDGEGGDYTERAGEVAMPPDLEKEVRNRLGPNRFNQLVNPSRLRAPPDMWAPRHTEVRRGKGGGSREPKKLPVQSLSCDHWFHLECIEQEARSNPDNPRCPQCRLPIRADDLRDMGLGYLLEPAPTPAPTREEEIARMAEQAERATQRQRQRAGEALLARERRQEVEARQRQLKQIDRLRVSVAKQQIKKWDQVVKDAARRLRAEKKVEVAEIKLARIQASQNPAIRRGIAAANAQLDSARATRDATPEAVRRHEDDAGARRGKLFLQLRHLHALRTADYSNQVASDIETLERSVWHFLQQLNVMYRDSDAATADSATHGLVDFIDNNITTDDYDEQMAFGTSPRVVMNGVFARTYDKNVWLEGGRYNEDHRDGLGGRWYGSGSYAQMTRGMWIVDPLVPLPDETQALRWPPAPQGAVTHPPDVNVWSRSGEGSGAVWQPDGLH